jgi:hypothetical protein
MKILSFQVQHIEIAPKFKVPYDRYESLTHGEIAQRLET